MSNALVIIPTYNEKENIHDMIHEVFSLPKSFHLLIVDDGSPDGTAQVVKELQKKFNTSEVKLHLIERSGKLGLGTAYITGFRFAFDKHYEYVLEMDCDFSHNPKDLIRLLAACEEGGYDLSVGSRYSNGMNVVNWPMSRVLMSYFASKYVRFITRMPIHDTTAGFVCYRKTVLQNIHLESIRFIGYAFQIEMKFLAWKYQFKLTEVPIIFTDRTKGKSKMSAGIFKEAVLGVLFMTIHSWFKNYAKA